MMKRDELIELMESASNRLLESNAKDFKEKNWDKIKITPENILSFLRHNYAKISYMSK